MSGVSIKYKGSTIVNISETDSKTLNTRGKYCEEDIIVSYVKPESEPPVLQSKSIEPTESLQVITPDNGYDGLSQVQVGAIQTETKTVTENGTVTPSSGKYLKSITVNVPAASPNLQSKSVTPSTSQQIITPDSSYDGLSQITVEAMPAGSLSTPTISSSGLITAQVGTSGYLASGTEVTKQLTTQAEKTVTPTVSEQTVVDSAVYTTGAVKVAAVPSETKTITANGTYTPSSGKFFSSVTVNVPSSSGGGSSDNNCEAYHITSASATLNFKTTGTVKVWGYGYKSGGYMGTHYSFVGDGYYSGVYGTPRKTTASFSINADGTLNGLPSGLTEVDLLVTIGV